MKRSVDELAALGGEPTFAEPLCVGRPGAVDRERFLARLEKVLDTRIYTNDGPFVRELEERLANLCGARHCVATANGTLALQVAARALGLAGEVVLPSFTFVATAHALAWIGLTPVFADVEPSGPNLDPADAACRISPRTSALVGVHAFGRPCDVAALTALARRRGVPLLLDAAHALGTPLAGLGDATVLSLHATKLVTSFEGGAILTDDAELAGRARLLRNFGFEDYDSVTALGINAKLCEPAAAMGLTSLEGLAAALDANRVHHETYRTELDGLPGARLLPASGANLHYVVLEVDESVAGLSRDTLHRVLWAEGVLARRYFYPGCHRMEPYRSHAPAGGWQLPRTERLASRTLCLPTGTAVTGDEVRAACGLVRLALRGGAALEERLRSPATAAVSAGAPPEAEARR